MGRIALGKLAPAQAREAVARHFRSLTNNAGVNLAQFAAQRHEEGLVELLAGFAYDINLPPALRRQCALDVLVVARGVPKAWNNPGETIDPAAIGATGVTHGEEIEQARSAAATFEELTLLVARRVPVDQWPERVRIAAKDSLDALTEGFEGGSDSAA